MKQSQKKSKALPFVVLALLLPMLAAAAACGDGGDAELVEKLFGPQDNELIVYDLETGDGTVLIEAQNNTVNGHVCLLPDGSGNFLLGEDTGQPEERQGWGIFSPEGELVNKILEPESPGEAEQPEPFGCGFDAEERLFTVDTGTGSFDAENGKLVLYFPPDYEESCLIDTTLRTAGAIAIDTGGNVYVPEAVPPGLVRRFSAPFPASADECDDVQPDKSVFIDDPDVQTPLGIVQAPNGNWYVSSVLLPPTVREYDAEGNFVRTIVEGDDIGNPSGIAVDADGTLYYADLGIVEQPPPAFFGPEGGRGTVRKVTFDENGEPLPPEIIADGLSFPDAVSILAVEE